MSIDLTNSVNEEQELSRNATHPLAMTAIYDVLTSIDMGQSVDVESILSALCEKPYADVDPFLKASVIFAIKEYPHIVAVFNAHMNKWRFDRLNRVEQAILILAYVHFHYVEPDVDKRVVINIAVKLTKTYCEEKDYRFVNAILDNVLVRSEKNKAEEGD